MWNVHDEAPSRQKKMPKIVKLGRSNAIFVCLIKFLKILFFEFEIAVSRSFFKILRSNFFANNSNYIVEKDSEIKIWCYRGSGVDLFHFLGF